MQPDDSTVPVILPEPVGASADKSPGAEPTGATADAVAHWFDLDDRLISCDRTNRPRPFRGAARFTHHTPPICPARGLDR